MIEEYKQRFDQALSRLHHALDDTDLIRQLTVEYLQDIGQPINAKAHELQQLESQIVRRRAELNDLDEKIKQRRYEFEWSGSQQEYVIRQFRAAIQNVTWEKPSYGQRHVGKWYNDRFEAAVTRAINRRIEDLLEISRMRLSNGQIKEYSQRAKEARQKLAGELRHARKRLREIKTIKFQRWRELENIFALVPPPLLGVDQIMKNGTAIPNKSGIYFIWEGPRVAYVGQSINLAQRLLNHPRLQPDDKISYLCIDRSELFYHEAFYIAVCHPWRNGGGLYQKVSKIGFYPALGDSPPDSVV